MSRITKWKLEKTKVKAVFRLQFHATNIPQKGWDKLFISFISIESGKSTAKTTKANVRNGTCKWADPIYETTRLLQDTKSKQYDDKLYKLVVAMGTSRSSVLGEAIINLADYADAQDPSSAAMSLQGCNTGTILHVTVQLLTSKTGFREFEQQRELREGGLPSGSNLNESGTVKISSPHDIASDHLDKVNPRSRFKPKSKELPLLEEYADSAIGFDGSSSTSDSLYPEKHETSSLKSTVSADLNGVSQDQSPQTEKENSSNIHQNLGWSSDYSIDNDSAAVTIEENNRLRETLQVAESSIFELKLELCSLQSNANDFRVETGNLARQLANEILSSEELGKEILILKEESLKFKEELKRLENLKLSSECIIKQPVQTDPAHIKGLLVVEDRVRELLNKAADISFLRSDFEVLLGVLEDLNQGKESTIRETTDEGFYQGSRVFELSKQLDESKVENENLARKMEEMECYYESLIHELEENQKQMVYTISAQKVETESINQPMNEQIIRFSKEREDFVSLTKELERRANTSEAALKRARLNYSIAVDKLQKDLELLSFQVLSVYETNANLIKQTFSEVNPELVQNLTHQRQIKGGDFYIEELKKSLRLQEDLYVKVEEELFEMHSMNLYLDVFSKALEETLVEADTGFKVMNEKMHELAKESEVSNASRDLLRVKVMKAMEEIKNLEFKANFIAKEKCLLSRKIDECEATMKAYSEEKSELENVLIMEKVESEVLQNEMSTLKEELKVSKDCFDDVAASKESMQLVIDFLDDKLRGLLVSYGEELDEFPQLAEVQNRSLEFDDFRGIFAKLEEIQHNRRKAVLQLTADKKQLEDDKGAIELSLINARSEIVSMKQKFKNDIHNMVTKIDTSNARVEVLQSKLDSVCRKFQISSEFEEKHTKQSKEILTDLSLFEAELQKLTSRNRDLAQEIMGLDTVYEELERSECTVTKLKKETHELTVSLDGRNVESAALAYHLNCLKESFSSVQDELNVERGLRRELEGKIEDLTSQLGMFELEKSRVMGLESELLEMHENLIAAGVEIACLRSHYETKAEFLAEKLQYSDENLRNIQKKHLDAEAKLKICIDSEARYKEENMNLLKDVESLRFDLESVVAQNRSFSDSNSTLKAQLEECKRRMETLEEEQLKHMGENDEQLKYEVCLVEKRELENLLRQKNLEKESLQNELFSLREEFDDVADSKENLQKIIEFLEEKLRSLLASYEKQFEVQNRCLEFDDFKRIILEIEEMQNNMRRTVLQLKEEKKELEKDKGTTEVFLSDARSDILDIKHKFKDEIYNLATKIDISNSRSEKLQSKLDSVTSQLQSYSDFEEKRKEIFADLTIFETELQKLASKNRDLAQEILGLDTVYEELEKSEFTVIELRKEIHDLTISLNGKDEEFATLESQLNNLEESLGYVQDELTVERGLRDEVEGKIGNLTSRLTEIELEKSALICDSQQNECELFEVHELLIATTVELTCVRTQYETLAELLDEQLQASDANHRNAEVKLRHCISNESFYTEENARLVKDLEYLRSELECSAAENKGISDSNKTVKETIEEEQLKHKVDNDEEDIETQILSKQELEIIIIVLKSKLYEQHAHLITLEDRNNESLNLKKQFNELNHKLSEQILKTEEFKNLSIHLRDLRDEAEAELKSLLARTKQEHEGPSVAIQESLRIAFIKEQYETKVQELKQQLSISKKHGEEMLWKLQDVLDEIENRKKSEALQMKRNEELSIKILELEGELQSVIVDKRERVNDYDRIKAELECALLSLECCKEEKEKLVVSFEELKVQNSKIAAEHDLRKGLMEESKFVDRYSLTDSGDLGDVTSISNGEHRRSLDLFNALSIQGVVEAKGLHGIQEDSIVNIEDFLLEDSKYLAVDNNHFRAESLKSSLEHLHEELEQMKNDNSLLQRNVDPKVQDLEDEFSQLQKANEELGNMFPLFNEIGGVGNALERVLALEIELAESLREKKKSTLQFQSSFLKQHSDEEAVFRSFRDINELIKEMLELKGRYGNVETDLKEMHDRYSQLSLQFAEVEGERQKLMMTLKNIRTPKKLVRSSSANLDLPS